MKRSYTISIKRRSQPEWLLWMIVMLPFLFGTLNDFLGLPWMIRYVLDIAWIALLGMMVQRKKYTGNWKIGGAKMKKSF